MKKLSIAVFIALTTLAAAAYASCPMRVTCAVDDLGMWYTGKNFTQNGHFFEVFRCPNGHEIGVRCD